MTKPGPIVAHRENTLTPSEWKKEDYLNYGGPGRPYGKTWKEYNSIKDCIKILNTAKLIHMKSIIVLGAATGEILHSFHSAWNTRPYGCELSQWAYEQIPHPYRQRIKNQDMRYYVKECARTVDMVYANSFMYLAEPDIPWVLKECARIGRLLFVDLSYSECFDNNDRHRKVLKPHRWWRDQFRAAGFVPVKRYRRLWQSTLLG